MIPATKIVGAGLVLLVFVAVIVSAFATMFEIRDKDEKFKQERRIIKICHDGTRIYEYEGKTMTAGQERILPEACQ